MFILLLYLFLPLIFSIFPFTQGWATVLFDLIWSPFRDVLLSVWHFIPNLFTILVIYFVIKLCGKVCEVSILGNRGRKVNHFWLSC